MAVVDYKGRRFLAQTTVPGLLDVRLVSEVDSQRPTASLVMSGTIDGGATLYNDERVQPQLKALAEKLHWDTSLIKVTPREDEETKPSELDAPSASKPVDAKEPVAFLGPADGKLMRGIDGNIYALDFVHSQPVDVYWMQEENSRKEPVLTRYILRPELADQLLRHRQESEIRAKAIRELLESWKKGEKIEDMTEEKAKELEKQAEMLEEYGRRGGWM